MQLHNDMKRVVLLCHGALTGARGCGPKIGMVLGECSVLVGVVDATIPSEFYTARAIAILIQIHKTSATA